MLSAAELPNSNPERQAEEISRLYHSRPYSLSTRVAWFSFLVLLLSSWWLGDFSLDDFLSERRIQNLHRFLGELIPYPLQNKDFDIVIAFDWALNILRVKGFNALWITLGSSIVAIVLAATGALVFGALAASTLMSPDPYVESRPGRLHWLWNIPRQATALLLMFLRAIPEYIWAFIFLSVLGGGIWTLILALAVHNVGALGRLYTEIIENAVRPPLAALRAAGASRKQILGAGLVPMILPRFLLYLFVRWETCIRESTVLGLLGVASIGYWIQDARARTFYDEMFLLVLLGGFLVLLGDIVSTLAREILRKW